MVDRIIQNDAQFMEFVLELSHNTDYNKSLELYLSALWKLLDEKRNSPPTWELFATLIEKAYIEEAPPFDPAWLDFSVSPDSDRIFKETDFAIVQDLILFQIADLHRMSEAGTLSIPVMFLYTGVESPSKSYWYNFHPRSFWSCAFGERRSTGQTTCNWGNFAVLLKFGQEYE
ncbi:MAG: hypothetical protein BroJett018_13920 [Chloroflexota bacterium]|nr:hypothetical protein [Chloroflexota bacterium]NOG62941.1 hypothetical protein [Chloroflexota bacterium]GIK63598.1 MAG: hypothetical protein BroJett018_13920 [Chloroflexota bacterium]